MKYHCAMIRRVGADGQKINAYDWYVLAPISTGLKDPSPESEVTLQPMAEAYDSYSAQKIAIALNIADAQKDTPCQQS